MRWQAFCSATSIRPAKLTVSVPKHVGQLPVYYNGKRSRGKRYLEEDSKARYPFGYGLSYTTFGYDRLNITKDSIGANESAIVSVDVTNNPAAGPEQRLFSFTSRMPSAKPA